MQRLQKPELHDHEEPEEASGPARDEEVLQQLPETYGAQGSEVTAALKEPRITVRPEQLAR
jgi:hypothetical protein